jgi:hypothetical protein
MTKVKNGSETENSPVSIRFRQQILGMFRFGKEVKVSPRQMLASIKRDTRLSILTNQYRYVLE